MNSKFLRQERAAAVFAAFKHVVIEISEGIFVVRFDRIRRHLFDLIEVRRVRQRSALRFGLLGLFVEELFLALLQVNGNAGTAVLSTTYVTYHRWRPFRRRLVIASAAETTKGHHLRETPCPSGTQDSEDSNAMSNHDLRRKFCLSK